MTKKELEEKLEKVGQEYEKLDNDYKYLNESMSAAANRIQENINLIESNLKNEKNKEKKKLLGGLLNEFQYIKNLLDLNDLPF